MATNTTKLALSKPDGTDLVDIAVLNANADKIDAASGATICTSTTRPASPWNGQLILETDTNNFYVYITAGATWLPVGSAVVSVTKPTSAGKGSFWMDPDTMRVYIYYTDANSSQWVEVGGGSSEVPTTANATTRDAMYPSPVQGNKVFRNDLGFEQTYYGAWNATTNPGGRVTAGWYDNQRNMGLVPIVPPTVRISGGTATANSLGTISFSAATSIGLDGIFTSAYTNYRLVMSYGCTASSQLQLRYTVSGTPNSTSNYNYGGWWARATSGANNYYSSAAASAHGLGFTGADSATVHSNSVDIYNPQQANKTTHTALVNGVDATSYISVYTTGAFNATTQFDGIYIYLSSAGSISGSLTIYGWNS